MTLKVYAYKKCSTCNKATKFLKTQGKNFEELDITVTPPSKAELKAMLQKYSGEIRKLFNTSGQAYRDMQLGSRLETLSENEALELLANNGRLVKRPFLLKNGKGVAVGFQEKDWKV